MGISIKNEEVEALARELARRHNMGVTEIIKAALTEKADRDRAVPSLWENLKPIHTEIEKCGKTGLEADKSFYDRLAGED